VSWRRADARHFALEVIVPDNVTATVQLPATAAREVRERGRKLGTEPAVKVEVVAKGTVRLTVGSGHYFFTVAPHPRRYPNTTVLLIFVAFVLLAAVALIAEVLRRSSPRLNRAG
jgi:hypothetical protein